MSWRVRVRAEVGDFDLDVDLAGEVGPTAIVGPNGSGKTTLLRLIAGSQRPTEGRSDGGGHVLFDSARGIDRAIERRGIGYVPQGYGLFEHLSVVGNIGFGLSAGSRRTDPATVRARTRELLEAFGIAALADRNVRTLSGGERQRVALARAFAISPRLLLLDEPMAALDVAARRRVRKFLAATLRAPSGPSVVVTHDLRDVQALGADVYVLEGGRIVQRGSVDALRAAPATEFVAELVGVDGLGDHR